ncbi:MAG: sulfatase-like hydrolase/transferase [Bacteroidales bacterium]|nr:sulfatase-like hydrolase/transferase [Bacteroidales bacterium]
MSITKILQLSGIILLIIIQQVSAQEQKGDHPNLLIIHTDEHNLRTLGCYRATMTDEQAHMWGKGVVVETPNIDGLAEEGLLCTNWYATSPVCTPSRASMISGLYPIATGSHQNNLPLKDDLVSFAHILKENGYATSYVGKWHLDGYAKPGFEPVRNFGFDDNRYMFNRGHWKVLGEDETGPMVLDKISPEGWAVFNTNIANEKSFATDFLVDRTIEIMDRDKDTPFCVMLSLPDPHGPDKVRIPYSEMFMDISFKEPENAHSSEHGHPKWNKPDESKKVENFHKTGIAQYFGMVKCIDDNVGRIMDYLKAEGLDKNTIVVFTSDHGDLMGEHGKLNKGLPYEMSARVAFLLKYPGHVKAGKQIQKAYTMADFTPTILGLMGINHTSYTFHGMDASKDFTNSNSMIIDDRIVYLTNAFSRWVAAVNNRYKLVLSPVDKPWLFDLQEDPDEMINFYNNPKYSEIAKKMEDELYRQMEQYNEPLLKEGTIIQ